LEIRLDEANPIVLSLFRSANGAAPFCTYPAADESAIVVNADSPAAAVSVNNVPVTIRRDQRTLSSTERQSFLAALDRLNLQPPRKGPKTSLYGDIVGVHAEMVHDMHGNMGPYGVQRFLPWHRIYLLQLEQALQKFDPTVSIPYWDWTVDRNIPDWIAPYTPWVRASPEGIQVVRKPGDPAQIPNLPLRALDDQQQPAAVMDPWTEYTEERTHDTIALHYVYDQ
jgi:hypothetical protein